MNPKKKSATRLDAQSQFAHAVLFVVFILSIFAAWAGFYLLRGIVRIIRRKGT